MASISGQNNLFILRLNNILPSSPVVSLCIHTDRTEIRRNYVVLRISEYLQTPRAFKDVNDYAIHRLQKLGAELITFEVISGELLSERPWTSNIAPSHIKVANYANARAVVQDLLMHQEMSMLDRIQIEKGLKELEISARFASIRTESISLAQKEMIQSVVAPYIDDIQSKAPNRQTAKEWVQQTSTMILNCGDPNFVRDNLSYLINLQDINSENWVAEDFYECLFTVAKIYANMADLESTLERLGDSLPSKSIIQQTILECFDLKTPDPS